MITIPYKGGQTRSVEPANGCFIPPWVTICPDLTDQAVLIATVLYSLNADPRSTNADLMNLAVSEISFIASAGRETPMTDEDCRSALRCLEKVGIVCDYRLGPLRIPEDERVPLNLSVHEFPVNGYTPPCWTLGEAVDVAEGACSRK